MTRKPTFPGIASIVLPLALAASPALAAGHHPAFHPGELAYHGPGKPNAVLVLGTPHLAQLPEKAGQADAKMVAPLLDRLAAWKPDAIATENLSGMQCFLMRQYPSRYAETVETYCPDTALAHRVTGLDVPSANARAEAILADWPRDPGPEQRRHLAAVFLAAGEPNSALVQWWRLPEAERHAGDGLDEKLVEVLRKRAAGHGESTLVAVALAARLGLERVWSVDDHSADTPYRDAAEEKAAGEAIGKAWDNPATARRKASGDALEANLGKPGGLMAMYRAYNDPAQALETYNSDFGAAMNEPSPQQFGRGYAGWWETRNLRMVSNIREVLSIHPGTRLLAIVGASHKFYYEAYLGQMSDVQLADAEEVLR